MHTQVNTVHEKYMEIWVDIIKQKISNQSRALSIMGLEGAEKIAAYVATVNEENVDYCESLDEVLFDKELIPLSLYSKVENEILYLLQKYLEKNGIEYTKDFLDGLNVEDIEKYIDLIM